MSNLSYDECSKLFEKHKEKLIQKLIKRALKYNFRVEFHLGAAINHSRESISVLTLRFICPVTKTYKETKYDLNLTFYTYMRRWVNSRIKANKIHNLKTMMDNLYLTNFDGLEIIKTAINESRYIDLGKLHK